jgi:hypothetical protein
MSKDEFLIEIAIMLFLLEKFTLKPVILLN